MPCTLRLRTLIPVIPLVVLGTLLAGCAGNSQFATLTGAEGNGGGACSAFDRPEYQIRGATPYDQKWADKTTEAGVAGCGWERPAARPESLDAKPMPVKAMPPAAPPMKRHWYDRFRKAKTS